MVIDLKPILDRYGIVPSGIIQVGAHWAEELADFDRLGIKELVLIEPLKEAFSIMQNNARNRPDTLTFNAALASREGKMTMFVETVNQGQSSSLLKPKHHVVQHPDIVFDKTEQVTVMTMDGLGINYPLYNGIVIDVQGAELEVFKGAEKTLAGDIQFIYTEVNREEMYENCTLVEDLDEFLKKFGFVRVETNFWGSNYGDAVYIKNPDIVYATEMHAPPEFSEEAYLMYHPDVADAVRRHIFPSGKAHYDQHGKNEGRKWYTLISTNLIIPDKFQQPDYVTAENTVFYYPEGNTMPFEKWYHGWLLRNNPSTNRIYLPIYWTSYYVNNKYGTDQEAIAELQKLIDRLDKSKKYYTVVQYDDGILNDISGLDIIVYGSGSNKKGYYPIPLSAVNLEPVKVDYASKSILYSFTGKETHPVRRKLLDELGKHAPISLETKPYAEYLEELKKSIFALCPRGYGASSFRIAEAMMYGCIPVYISDEFIEPFNIPFETYGVKVREDQVHLIPDILAKIEHPNLAPKTYDAFRDYYLFESIARNIVHTLR
jgi:FkbM family methyltransferase